jgi:hypothetical protein
MKRMPPANPDISLDQTYHYPPELLEMLTEAIRCLFKSKQGVIDFFRGASTPRRFWLSGSPRFGPIKIQSKNI